VAPTRSEVVHTFNYFCYPGLVGLCSTKESKMAARTRLELLPDMYMDK